MNYQYPNQMMPMGFMPYYYNNQAQYYQHNQNQIQLQADPNYQFKTNIPRLEKYDDLSKVKELCKLDDLNSESFNPDEIQNGQFFIIKSTNEDDIHKSIKYGVWVSSPKNNEVLSKAFQEAQKNGEDIYLFYNVVKTGQFCGVAKMVSDFDAKQSFKYWWDELKWFGLIHVKWIYICYIQESKLNHIREKSNLNNNSSQQDSTGGQQQLMQQSSSDNKGKPVSDLPDCSKISIKSGKQLLNIFKQAEKDDSILKFFVALDQREDQLQIRRNNEEYDKKFEEMKNQFAADPMIFQRNKKQFGNKKNPMQKKGGMGGQGYQQYYPQYYQPYYPQQQYYYQQQQQYQPGYYQQGYSNSNQPQYNQQQQLQPNLQQQPQQIQQTPPQYQQQQPPQLPANQQQEVQLTNTFQHQQQPQYQQQQQQQFRPQQQYYPQQQWQQQPRYNNQNQNARMYNKQQYGQQQQQYDQNNDENATASIEERFKILTLEDRKKKKLVLPPNNQSDFVDQQVTSLNRSENGASDGGQQSQQQQPDQQQNQL